MEPAAAPRTEISDLPERLNFEEIEKLITEFNYANLFKLNRSQATDNPRLIKMDTFYKSKKNAAKIRDFLKKYPEAKVYAYEYGIPTGTAQTKGYGIPKEITIILADKSFKTRNSPHIILAESTYFRADYGTIKGHTAKVRDQYENLAMEIQEAIDKIR